MKFEEKIINVNWQEVRRVGIVIALVVSAALVINMFYVIGKGLWTHKAKVDSYAEYKPAEPLPKIEKSVEPPKEQPPVLDVAKLAQEVIKAMPIVKQPAPQNEDYINAILAKAKAETERAESISKRLKETAKEAMELKHKFKKLKEEKAKVVEKIVTASNCQTPMTSQIKQSTIHAQGKCPGGFIEETSGVCFDPTHDKVCFLAKSAKVGRSKKGRSLSIDAGKDLCI